LCGFVPGYPRLHQQESFLPLQEHHLHRAACAHPQGANSRPNRGGDHRLTLNFDDYDGPFEGIVLNVTDVTVTCSNLDTIRVTLDR
jgi:hypothetical protein